MLDFGRHDAEGVKQEEKCDYDRGEDGDVADLYKRNIVVRTGSCNGRGSDSIFYILQFLCQHFNPARPRL